MMGIKSFAQPPYNPDLAPRDFWLFPKFKEKLRGSSYEIIEEMKKAVTKVIDTLTQEDFNGAFQNLLERHNKCIAAGGDYLKENSSFMCVLSIKVPTRKKSRNLFNDSRISNMYLVLNNIQMLLYHKNKPNHSKISWHKLTLDKL